MTPTWVLVIHLASSNIIGLQSGYATQSQCWAAARTAQVAIMAQIQGPRGAKTMSLAVPDGELHFDCLDKTSLTIPKP